MGVLTIVQSPIRRCFRLCRRHIIRRSTPVDISYSCRRSASRPIFSAVQSGPTHREPPKDASGEQGLPDQACYGFMEVDVIERSQLTHIGDDGTDVTDGTDEIDEIDKILHLICHPTAACEDARPLKRIQNRTAACQQTGVSLGAASTRKNVVDKLTLHY